ncbi:MAG: hypothetical protein K6A38_05395 [Lachnospiraceae bacterium]|nr:hypothetical protein [Lachnospiraceae bacterium]
MEEKKFDPMTGEPIVEQAAQEPVQTTFEDAVSAAPVEPEKKGGKGKLIAIIAAAVVLVAAIVCLVVFVILPKFGKPITKIEKAFENTFSSLTKGDNLLLTALSPEGLEKTDTFTMTFEGELEDYGNASIDFIKTKDALQICAGVDVSDMLDVPYIDAQFLWDDEAIRASSSLLNNQYVYYYTEEPDEDGFLAEVFEEMESEGLDAETINGALKDYYDTIMDFDGITKANEDLTEELKEHFRDLEVKKIDSNEFEINGKDVKCEGYTVVVTEKDLKKALDSYSKAVKSTMEKSMGTLLEVADTDVDELFDEAFSEVYDSIEDMDDIEFDIYLYKNEVAAIEMEVEDSKLSIQFQGGDYRAQNILVDVDGSKLEITGEKDGNTEKASVKVDKEEYFSYEFDSKKGDLSLKVSDGYDEYELEGINVSSKSDELVVSLDELDLDGIVLTGSFTLKKAAKLKDMSGDEFNIGDATEDELMETLEDEQEALEELSGLESLFGGSSYDYDDYDWDDEDWEDYDWDDEDSDW